MSRGLCENPECGSILDAPGVRHRDAWDLVEVLLCLACTSHFAAAGASARYRRLDPNPKERADGRIEQ